MTNRRGFTLIELLVVISIIGLLSSVALVALNNSRTKARDAKRRADLKQLATALEMYYSNNNGYPNTSGGWWGNCSDFGSHDTTGANGWIPNLAPTYANKLPLDPKYNGNGGCYLYRSDGRDYKMLAHQTMESVCPVPSSDLMYDPPRAGQCTIQISTPGGASY